MIQFLYNSSGKWIAFKLDNYLYSSKAKWIGWFPWNDEHAVDKKGKYLGSIFDEDRFYKLNSFPYRGYPGYPGHPGYPGYGGYKPRPSGTTDFSPEHLIDLGNK